MSRTSDASDSERRLDPRGDLPQAGASIADRKYRNLIFHRPYIMETETQLPMEERSINIYGKDTSFITRRLQRFNDEAMRMRDYAFTLKSRKRVDCEYDCYHVPLRDWESRFHCRVKLSVPEKDKHGRLHFHGVVSIPDDVYRGDLVDKSVFSYRFTEIMTEKQRQGWLSYCAKGFSRALFS